MAAQKSLGAWLRWLFLAVVAAGLALFAVLHLALLLIFFGNFNFSRPEHAGIFWGTAISIVITAIALVRLHRRRGAILMVAAAGLTGLTVWLWSIPGARGLIH